MKGKKKEYYCLSVSKIKLNHVLIPEPYAMCRSDKWKVLCLNGTWKNFNPQAYYKYSEYLNFETTFNLDVEKDLKPALHPLMPVRE